MSNLIEILTDQYTDAQINSANVFLVQSMDGSELQYDTMDATLDLSGEIPTLLSVTDADAVADNTGKAITVRPWIHVLIHDPAAYIYGSVVKVYHDSQLLGKYYMESISRVGKTTYAIKCISPIGLLEKSMHYGGVYDAGMTFPAVVADVIGGVIPYTIDPIFNNQNIRGWLPVATRRENLHQVLFAMGACIKRDENGDIFISYLNPVSESVTKPLSDGRIYTGGSIQYADAVSAAIVYEHEYRKTATDELITLFEGDINHNLIKTPMGSSVEGDIILFDQPCYDLSVTGTSIYEQGENYAVLLGGNGVVLTGKAYTHTMRQVVAGDDSDTSEENVVTIKDATLVNLLNSSAVASRLYAYHHDANKVSVDILVNQDRPGDSVVFNDPFDEERAGYIASMNASLSSVVKASTEIVTDYRPVTGNTYNNVEIFVQDDTWVVPEGVENIRLVLIGGGETGKRGGDGEDGDRARNNQRGTSGLGGYAGAGGDGGDIYVKTYTVQPGDVIAVNPGGSGGVSRVTINDTTSIRSSSGTPSASGFTDLIYGNTFGLPGPDGYPGGDASPNGKELWAEDPDTGELCSYKPGDDGRNS